jgi:hypothetical protein
MIRTTIAGVLACGAMLTGCAAETTLDTTDQGPAPAEQVCAAGTETVETTATMDAVEGMETTGEAASESAYATGCRAACAIAYALGCVSVGLSCSGVTTITLGGTTIPCAWAIIAACGVLAPGGTQVCMAYCPT